ncbi:MAG: hypothetical protein P8Z36_00550 [Gemmatimonadota bacterium]|jgi:hypothetical protein
MPRLQAIVAIAVVLAGCAGTQGLERAPSPVQTRLIVSNPTQYPVKVYASRTPNRQGWRLGQLAIGGHGAYNLPYSGDVFFRLVRLNGRMVRARAHVTPGDVVELEPNAAWSVLFVTVRPRP